MLYHVTRNGQNYGPYTLEDLTRYVQQGNILPSDLAKSDEMADWVMVSTLLHPTASVPPPQAAYAETFQPAYAAPAYPAAVAPGNPAPNLHWGLVFLFTFLTCGIFAMIWSIVLSAWMNRVVPASRQLLLGITVVATDLVLSFFNEHHQVNFNDHNWYMQHHHSNPIIGVFWIVWFVVLVYARFNMRNAMEQYYNTVEPMGLRLSSVMTFFFGGLYFQYHLNRIHEMKRAMMYGGQRF